MVTELRTTTAERVSPTGVRVGRVSVEVPASLKGAMGALAAARGTSLSDEFRQAALAHLDRHARLVVTGIEKLDSEVPVVDVVGEDGRTVVASVGRRFGLELAAAVAANTGERLSITEKEKS